MISNKSKPVRIGIVGSGFSGSILARQLLRHDIEVEVVVFEKTQRGQVKRHWTQPVTGAGLNINPNAMATLKQIDHELYDKFHLIGANREIVTGITIQGEKLYKLDVIKDHLADAYGCRVRWDDANTLMRSYLEDVTVYDSNVVGCTIEKDEKITLSINKGGNLYKENNFDLLIACDGRYSSIRSTTIGVPETTFGKVCNFRILLPNCNLDGSLFYSSQGKSIFFDDLQLFYNENSSIKNLPKNSILRHDPVFTRRVLRSNMRVGIMRIPSSNFRDDVKESLYLFGNFSIPEGKDIPESAKTAEALYCLLTPAEGDVNMTEEAKYIRDAVSSNAERLHWSRFQDIPVVYHDDNKKILFLGDAAHGFSPALGQGATLAIEDACLASHLLLSSIRKNEPLSIALDKISKFQLNRAKTIRDMSNEAAEHILFEEGENSGMSALTKDSESWLKENSPNKWRHKVRNMWLGYPKIQDPDRRTWLQIELEKNSTDQFYPEFDQFLSSHLVSTVVALEKLGANRKQVQEFLSSYTKKLIPGFNSLKNTIENSESTENLFDLLGKRQEYYRIRNLYFIELEFLNGNVSKLVEKKFPLLSPGIAGSLLHGLINLGYSIHGGSKKTIIEQLAYLHYTSKPIIYKRYRKNYLSHFGKGPMSFMGLLMDLQKDKNNFTKLQHTRELEMRLEKNGWFSSTPQYRIAAMLEEGDLLLDYVNKINIPYLNQNKATDSDIVKISKWILDKSIEVYALCKNKNEFVLMHGVTASWALCQIVPFLQEIDALNTIKHMLCILLAIYIVQDCPAFHSFTSDNPISTMDDWESIRKRTLAHEGDEHIYKVVAVCKERWFEFRDKTSYEAQLCQLAAQVALDNPIYWHKYDYPEEFNTKKLLGVSGIRNNIF